MNQRFTSSLAFTGSAIAAAIAAALMSGHARAEGPIEQPAPFVSTLSRAEVQADLMRNRGLVTSYASEWALQQNSTLSPGSAYTRAQARADYIASREEVRAMTAEHGGSGSFAVAPSRMPSSTTVAGTDLR